MKFPSMFGVSIPVIIPAKKLWKLVDFSGLTSAHSSDKVHFLHSVHQFNGISKKPMMKKRGFLTPISC